MRRIIGAALILALLFGSGCYSFVPTEMGNVEPGTFVRARMAADPGSSGVTSGVGRVGIDAVVDGRLVEAGTNRVVLDVPAADREIGGHVRTMYERVVLSRAAVGVVEVRQLDRLRTGVLIGAIGVTVVALLLKSLQVIDPGGAPPVPPDGEL